MNEIDYILELLKSESMKPEQLGIPGSSITYQMLDDNQDSLIEYAITTSFLREVLSDAMFSSKATVEFINYGSTEQYIACKSA